MGGAHYLRGDDEVLLGSAVSELVARLVGDGDRALTVTELDGDEFELAALVDAAQTPPFLTERRIVVGRGIGRFSSDEVAPLVAFLADPLPTTELVLTGGGGRVAKPLLDVSKKVGAAIVDTDAPAGAKDRRAWIDDHVDASGVRLDAPARAALAAHLGEDLGRLGAILAAVQAAYGAGATVRADDLVPFLGDAGGVPPWDLTDAIDRGDARVALEMLSRMMAGGERHPLQVMAIIHNHVSRMMRLDGTGIRDDRAAAEVLGLKSPFQARKALDGARKLGHQGVVRAIELLAQADLDLRGAKDWPPELVMEVLVARLARIAAVTRR